MGYLAPYQPHPKQAAFHADPARYCSASAGIGGGKTFAGPPKAWARIAKTRREKRGFLHFWVIAPDFPLGKPQRRAWFQYIGGAGSPIVEDWKKTERELWLRSAEGKQKTLIEFKSADNPDSLVAVGLDGLWLDEPARIDEEAWLNLRARLSRRAGWAIFTGTPKGRNWYYEYLIKPALEGNPEYGCHTWFTSDNPYYPPEEVEKARRELPPAFFRREYEASFDAFLGQVYEEWNPSIHVTGDAPADVVETRYGVDFGFRDPNVFVCGKRDGSGLWTVVGEFVKAGQAEDQLAASAKEFAATYGAGTWFCDSEDARAMNALRRAGLSVRPANKKAVIDGIRTVSKALRVIDGKPGLKIHRRCSRTLGEFPAYRWREGAKHEEPVKDNDHAMDALRYMLHTPSQQAASIPGHVPVPGLD